MKKNPSFCRWEVLLSEFVRFTNWIFTHYTSEEVRLKVWMGIGTVLFCHTKENADYGWQVLLGYSQKNLPVGDLFLRSRIIKMERTYKKA